MSSRSTSRTSSTFRIRLSSRRTRLSNSAHWSSEIPVSATTLSPPRSGVRRTLRIMRRRSRNFDTRLAGDTRDGSLAACHLVPCLLDFLTYLSHHRVRQLDGPHLLEHQCIDLVETFLMFLLTLLALGTLQLLENVVALGHQLNDILEDTVEALALGTLRPAGTLASPVRPSHIALPPRR